MDDPLIRLSPVVGLAGRWFRFSRLAAPGYASSSPDSLPTRIDGNDDDDDDKDEEDDNDGHGHE